MKTTKIRIKKPLDKRPVAVPTVWVTIEGSLPATSEATFTWSTWIPRSSM